MGDDRFLQIGLGGYWPEPETLSWMAGENMRSYQITEIGHRGWSTCLPVVGIDVVEMDRLHDNADIIAALGNRVVLECLSASARKRQDERNGTTWDPSLPLLSDREAPIPQGSIRGHSHDH